MPVDVDPMVARLAQQLVACPQWRWESGMRVRGGELVLAAGPPLVMAHPRRGIGEEDPRRVLPDLLDPGTVGHLVAFLGERGSFQVGHGGRLGWTVSAGGVSYQESLGVPWGAVVARALLAVWGRS